MQSIPLEKQEAEPIDEATHAALDEAEAQIQRGEFVSLAEARVIIRKRYKTWQKMQQEALTA